MSGISVVGLRKAFGAFEALKSVSLEVRDQEFAVLLGPSGCGKTTLLRIIAGLETETSGDQFIGDKRINGTAPRHRNLAMVFQNYAVFPHLTIFENIAFGLRMKKMLNADVEAKVKRAAGMMHIEKLLQRYPSQLSGGQRQRVAVARALAVEPDVLLMDEPLSNLDALLRLEMRAELKGLLQETRTTTIYVTHDQVEAMSLADRIAVMYGGEIVQYERPIDVYQNPATTFCGSFIGNPPMNFLKVRRDGDRLKAGGAELTAPTGTTGDLLLGIRPEAVTITDETEGTFVGAVSVVEPLGPHILLTLSVDGHPFRATVDADTVVSAGETIRLKARPDMLRWFDAKSTRAVA
jgi:multiple sugar transport system ATP-binding protein